MATIIAVCISDKKGVPKHNVKRAVLKEGHGLQGDAHAGPGIRQVSLLAKESLDEMKKKGIELPCGGFGENLTTEGIDLVGLKPGMRLSAGEATLEVTQIGKDCKKPCAIYKKHGDCILPSKGIFAAVIKGGIVKQGDKILEVQEKGYRPF